MRHPITLWALLSIFGCSNADPIDDLVGVYSTSFVETLSGDSGTSSETWTQSITITKGTASDLVIDAIDCPLPANFVGNDQLSVSSTTCTVSVDEGLNVMLTLSGSGTLVGGILNLNLSGQVTAIEYAATATYSLTISGAKL